MWYRVVLQIEADKSGMTYGPEPYELLKTDDPDEAINYLENVLVNLGEIKDDIDSDEYWDKESEQ